MGTGDNPAAAMRQSPSGTRADLLVVGGGIMGLWAAVHARRSGLSVLLVEEGRIGGGASGGLLGALMPHTPDRWNAKKQFQFDALLALEAEVARLEAETGHSTGYCRAGRLIPLPKPHLRDMARQHEADAARHWLADGRRFHWHVREASEAGERLSGGDLACGFVEDTFAARIDPRRFAGALRALLERDNEVSLLEGRGVSALDPSLGTARLSCGLWVAFGHAVIAAGHLSGRLVEPLVGPFRKPLVVPVKGQSALLAADLGADAPVIYRDGLYVVPHEGGRVAIGSTSENRFDDPFATDAQLDALIDAARALVPRLRSAAVMERWAGLRPKAIGRDPLAGPLPGIDRVSMLTGGFKVSFGIAHAVAEAVVATIVASASETGLPESFSPASHLREAGSPAYPAG